MDFFLALWLPILLSAAAVWIASMVLGMALPHHKRDFIAIPNAPGGGEDGLMDYLRGSGIPPGNYLFPDFRGREAMKAEKTQKALKEGPVGHLIVWNTPLTMGGKMVATFIVYLMISAVIAYLTRVAVPAATPPPSFAKIFQFAATAGVLAYCFSFIPNAVWWGSYKRTIAANVVDGVVYGAITGAIFAGLWPR